MGSQPQGISASRGAAVLGLSEYQTPLEAFQRIMEEREPGWNAAHGYALPPEPDNAAIRWGTAFEDAIVELAERNRIYGQKIINRECFYSVNGTPDDTFFERREGYELANYITCHVDGFYEGENILHEGKTTSAFTFRNLWGTPGTDRVPQAYQVQVQHQMLCTGAYEDIVSVLVFPETPDKWDAAGWKIEPIEAAGVTVNYRLIKYADGKASINDIFSTTQWAQIIAAMGYFHQYPVKANPETQRLMVEKYQGFWYNHILTGKPPEPRNYEDVKRLFPEPKSTIIVPDYIERKIAEYKGITEETTNAKKRKERLKTIVTMYAAKNIGIVDDESREAVIFMNHTGEKIGSWSKDKNGKLTFRS